MQNSINFVPSTGQVIFNGSSAQTIDMPDNFSNLTIANTAGVVSLIGNSQLRC